MPLEVGLKKLKLKNIKAKLCLPMVVVVVYLQPTQHKRKHTARINDNRRFLIGFPFSARLYLQSKTELTSQTNKQTNKQAN